jgi:hypothetical protein
MVADLLKGAVLLIVGAGFAAIGGDVWGQIKHAVKVFTWHVSRAGGGGGQPAKRRGTSPRTAGPVRSRTGTAPQQNGVTHMGCSAPGSGLARLDLRQAVLPPSRAVPDSARVCNVVAPIPTFTGRRDLLDKLHRRLIGATSAGVQALHGMGGIGKTQLAIQYVHQHLSDYDVAWWIDAEQPGLIGEQYAALGAAAGKITADTDPATAASTVKAWLRGLGRWLLVFDNAERPEDLLPWLPGGVGHVVITSRCRWWAEVAGQIEVPALSRLDSIALLTTHHRSLTTSEAYLLAEELTDLPLALVQAASLMAQTGASATDCRGLLAKQAAKYLDAGRSTVYPRTVASIATTATDQLGRDDPAALAMLRICALLGAGPIPTQLFTGPIPAPAASDDDDPIAALTAVHDAVTRLRSLGLICGYTLATMTDKGIHLHRLTRAVLRDQLPDELSARIRQRIRDILAATINPGPPSSPQAWPDWARWTPHILAADPGSATNTKMRELAVNAAYYLFTRAHTDLAAHTAEDLYHRWQHLLGPTHPHTLNAAHMVALVWHQHGRYDDARDLNQRNWNLRTTALGADHPDTFRSAHHLARNLAKLGDFTQALRIEEETWSRRRQSLGVYHLDTLKSAHQVARICIRSGHVERALHLDQDTLRHRLTVLGADHPDTLRSQEGLADCLRLLGHPQRARNLDEDLLATRQRVLGNKHPDTQHSKNRLATGM